MKIFAIINVSSEDRSNQLSNLTGFLELNGINTSDVGFIELSCDSDRYSAEAALGQLQRECEGADLIVFPGNDSGSELTVRLAARMGGTSLTDVLESKLEDETLVATKKAYAGNLLADYSMGSKPWCISVDRSLESENISEIDDVKTLEISENYIDALCSRDTIVSIQEQQDGLAQAEFVLACGQGFSKQAAVDRAAEIADKLGACLGASRPVVMNAWAPMNALVGVSGNMIKPQVCIAAAASGSPAFYTGIEKSKIIIAINQDEKAQIMSKSDMAIKGDAKAILDALEELL